MLNKLTIIGNVGSDVEMRYIADGKPVTNFSVAVNRRYTAGGEKREETDWFTVTTWNKLAENCNQYLAKGRQVYVEGRVSLHEWEGQDGIKRSRLELTADTVKFLGSKSSDSMPSGTVIDESDDLPFE